jgi:hypothetical protein
MRRHPVRDIVGGERVLLHQVGQAQADDLGTFAEIDRGLTILVLGEGHAEPEPEDQHREDRQRHHALEDLRAQRRRRGEIALAGQQPPQARPRHQHLRQHRVQCRVQQRLGDDDGRERQRRAVDHRGHHQHHRAQHEGPRQQRRRHRQHAPPREDPDAQRLERAHDGDDPQPIAE